MKPLIRVLFVLGLFLAFVLPSKAEGPYDSYTYLHEKDSAIVENFAIWYKVDSIDINPNYLDNRRQMDHIIHYLETSPRIDSITIYAWSSPEGRYSRNLWLSKERAKAARKFLLKHSPDSAKLNAGKIHISPIAENWQGLTDLVEASYTRADRQQVLDILYDTEISDQTRKIRLQRLDAGRSWRYMIQNYMPQLRTATWVCVWVEAPPVLPNPGIRRDTLICHRGTIITPPFPEKPILEEKKMLFAARTNLLIPALNVGLEFPIKNNWSLGIDYYYPWAVSSRNRWCTEMLGLFVDGKYWFTGEKYKWTKDEKLKGHAVGVYAGLGYYDFQKIDRGAQGEYVDVGVDYTFGLPVAKGKLRMEFNIGLGWILTYYRNYTPSSDYEDLIKDPGIVQRSTSFIGPTRASVSLVVPIRANKRIKF